MACDGLHSIVDPFTDDVKVIEYLIGYLSLLQDENYHGNSRQFIRETETFLKYLQNYYKIQNASSVSNWTWCLRQVLLLLSDTLYIQASSNVCKVAVETIVTTPYRVHDLKNDLLVRTISACDIARALQRAVCTVCEENHGGSSNNMMMVRQNGFSLNEEMVTMVMKAKQLQNLLEGCEALLSSVVQVIEEKVKKETKFYNSLSWSIGAICAGNLAWNLWRGGSVDDLISHGMWSVCTGFSAAVLQIPRVRLTNVTTELMAHQKQHARVNEVTKYWKEVEKLSYASLVKPALCRMNGFNNGKVREVESKCHR